MIIKNNYNLYQTIRELIRHFSKYSPTHVNHFFNQMNYTRIFSWIPIESLSERDIHVTMDRLLNVKCF